MCPKVSKPELLLRVNSLDPLIVAKLTKIKKIIIDSRNLSKITLEKLIAACQQLALSYLLLSKDNEGEVCFLSSLEDGLKLKKHKYYILPPYLNLDDLKDICQKFPLLSFGYIVYGKLCSFFTTYPCKQKNPSCANFGLNVLSKKLLTIENLKGWVIDSLNSNPVELFYQLNFYQQIINTPNREKLALKILAQGRVKKSTPSWFLPQSPKPLFLDLEQVLPFLGEVKGRRSRFLRPQKELFPEEKILFISREKEKYFFKVPKYIPAKGKLTLPLKIAPKSRGYLFLNSEQPVLNSLKKIKLKLNQTYKPSPSLPGDTSKQYF